jgi:hypothetical protein
MKKIFLVLVMVLIAVTGCSKKNLKLATFAPEAFAYDLGDGWEVNSTIRVRGFAQDEVNDIYKATFNYQVDLVTPGGKTIKNIFTKKEDKTDKEKMTDVPLEVQFELDSTYKAGKYKVVYTIEDVIAQKSITAEKDFDLGGD